MKSFGSHSKSFSLQRHAPEIQTACLIHSGGEGKSQIRMVAGFAEVIDREETLVAEACNHPNLLVIPFRAELIRCAA
jgi:hypothetical protein